jgi:hypothetical protein
VGSWKLPGRLICGNVPVGTTQPSSCPGYSATIKMDQSGTLTLASDGTFSSTMVLQGTEDFTYPRNCIGGMSCDELAAKMIASADRAAGSCSENASQSCVCSLRDVSMTTTDRGTYTASGGQLTAVSANSTPGAQASAYCVRSGSLLLHTEDPSTGLSVTMEHERQ